MTGPRASTWSFFSAGYLAAYFVSTAVPTPLLWYYPVLHRWAFQFRPQGLAMDFMGRLVLAFAAGTAAALAGRALPEARVERLARVATVWSALLFLFTAALYVYLLAGRNPLPIPLPDGYEPR